LIQRRGELAAQLDCLLDCDCEQDTINAQILGDKALYDIDHVIDLFIQGQQVSGIPEYRMRAFGYANFISFILNNNHGCVLKILNDEGDSIAPDWKFSNKINVILKKVKELLWIDQVNSNSENASSLIGMINKTAIEALCQQLLSEDSWRRLVRIMAPSCRKPEVAANLIEAIVDQAVHKIDNGINAKDAIFNCRNMKVYSPATTEESLEEIADLDRVIVVTAHQTDSV